MGQHHHGHQQDGHGHGHVDTDIDWAEMAGHLEEQAQLFTPMYRSAASWLAQHQPEPSLIADLGSGPGVVSCLLADQFPGARIVAVDGTGPLLERARARAERQGLADRFTTLEGELPGALDDLEYPVDLMWASNSLHHLGDQRAALAAFAERLAPGGTLAIMESGLPARFLPRDIGIGRAGLQSRLDAAQDLWFSEMRAGLPDSVAEPEDWPGLLASVGLHDATSRTFLLDLPAPLSDAARTYAVKSFQRGRGILADLLEPADLAVIDRLLDPDDKASLHHRTDVFVLAAHTVHVARA